MAEIVNNFGEVAGWSHHEVTMLGRTLVGVRKITYKDSIEAESIYGAGYMPVGTGFGNYKAEFSMELLKEELDALIASLPAGQRAHNIPAFDVPVLTIRNGVTTKDVVRNVRILGRGKEVSQGDKSVYESPTFVCSHIEWNVPV